MICSKLNQLSKFIYYKYKFCIFYKARVTNRIFLHWKHFNRSSNWSALLKYCLILANLIYYQCCYYSFCLNFKCFVCLCYIRSFIYSLRFSWESARLSGTSFACNSSTHQQLYWKCNKSVDWYYWEIKKLLCINLFKIS